MSSNIYELHNDRHSSRLCGRTMSIAGLMFPFTCMSYNVGLVYIELLGMVLVNPMSYNIGLVHCTTLNYWPARRWVLQ